MLANVQLHSSIRDSGSSSGCSSSSSSSGNILVIVLGSRSSGSVW